MELIVGTVVIGLGATATMDLWGIVRRQAFGVPRPDYGLVGRWLGHMRHGRFVHGAIATASPVPGERVIGWTAHYAIGVAFAALLIGGWGLAWLREPTLGPALIVGLATVAAPFLLLQPGMGLGLAARRAPRPWAARLHALATHAVFGLGLYAAGWLHVLFTNPRSY